VLSDTPPVSPELIYVSHQRGFALCSSGARTPAAGSTSNAASTIMSRIGLTSGSGGAEAAARPQSASTIVTGPSIEKSIAPLRSFVAEPIRFE
jgi:p-hydroxybenzoate 3-monooxygenase